jgi:hypothetical protein
MISKSHQRRSDYTAWSARVIRPFNCGLLSSALFLFLKPFGNAVALVPSERVELRRWGERGWQIDRQLGA